MSKTIEKINSKTKGSWTIYFDNMVIKGTRILYKCQCICGVISYKQQYDINNKPMRSCKKCYLNRVNITINKGDRFGRLIVTGERKVVYDSQTKYKCLCDCGNFIWANKINLLRELTHGCGNRCKILQDITDVKPGETYGAWTVLTNVIPGSKNSPNRKFECKCICGTIKYLITKALRKGESKYCKGCVVKEKLLELKPGETFGSWTVLEGIFYNDKGKKVFKTQCRCGFMSYHRKQSLTSGNSTQCTKCSLEGRYYKYGDKSSYEQI